MGGKTKSVCILYMHKLIFQQRACPESDLHENVRYTEGSAAWVLIASIIVFFMVICENT